MTKTIDLISRNTRLISRFGQLVIPDGETYIQVDGVRKLKLDKMAKCLYGHGVPDTPQFKGLNGETDVTVSYAPHTYYLELPPGYRVMPGGTTVHYPSMGICTGGSPTTLHMGAHLYVGFVFGVDIVSGAQTELCGADVWSEDGVSIPITCASGIIMIEKTSVCPIPTVSISNFKIVDTTASCDIIFDAGVGTTGDVNNSSLQRYNGASWNTSIEPLYYAFLKGASGTFHVEWEMVQAGDCVVTVDIANMCGNKSGFARKDLQLINPCEGVVCGPECFDSDLYNTICEEGVCVKGTHIESNSVECGYIPPTPTPPDDEPDDEIYDEVHDLPPLGSTCVGIDLYQLIGDGLTGDLIEANSPLCITAPPEDEGIFGGILMWVVIAVIAVIIFGLLT